MADLVDVLPAVEGARLRLRVKPGARRSRVVGPHGGALKLEVAAQPEKGRANLAVVELLAEQLGVAAREVEISAGTTSQDKTALVRRGADEVAERLAAAGIGARIG